MHHATSLILSLYDFLSCSKTANGVRDKQGSSNKTSSNFSSSTGGRDVLLQFVYTRTDGKRRCALEARNQLIIDGKKSASLLRRTFCAAYAYDPRANTEAFLEETFLAPSLGLGLDEGAFFRV